MPRIFIVAGNNVMSSWFIPLTHSQCGSDSRLTSFTVEECFPKSTLILASENGIVEQCLMRFVVERINLYDRRFGSQDKKYC